MICMIHKLNLRVGETDLCLVHYTFLKNNPSSGEDINSMNMPCLTVFLGYTSDYRNSNLLIVFCVCHCHTVFKLSVSCIIVVTFWERIDPLTLLYVLFFIFVTFQYGVLGQVWYLIVSIADLCLLPYFSTGSTYESRKSSRHG